MNRLVDYKIGGRTMRLNFSVAAAEALAETNGTSDSALAEIDELNKTDPDQGMVKLLELFILMAKQGKRYCDIVGESCDEPFTLEEMKTLAPRSGEEPQQIFDAVLLAVRNGGAQTVAVEAEKNVETAPDSQETD